MADNNGIDFKHAPGWLKKACKAVHISPTRYSVTSGDMQSDGKFTVKVWNSRKTKTFDQDDMGYAIRYL